MVPGSCRGVRRAKLAFSNANNKRRIMSEFRLALSELDTVRQTWFAPC